ncbi:MAG: 30S ribosomal protein S8e [Nitrososphaerota archaeon]|nr:30S ribosomal protein S8e [Nitrososphaerota archaeon]
MVKPIENLQKRKMTGGRTKHFRSRRAHEKDGYAAETLLGDAEYTHRRMRGGNAKTSLKFANMANVLDHASGKTQRVKIIRVLENPANRDYERRGVITKGAMIDTELGSARVMSRPAQDGVINALLISK